MCMAAIGTILTSCGKDDNDEPGDIAVTSVTITQGASHTLTIGGEVTFTATVAPGNATSKTVAWSSSAEAVVSIDARTGAAKALTVGTATITATAGGKSATCAVTVPSTPVTGITINEGATYALTFGSTAETRLTATVTPENATDKTVTWTVSNENVSITADGAIAPVKLGEAVVTATAGDFSANCVVTVNPPKNWTVKFKNGASGTATLMSYFDKNNPNYVFKATVTGSSTKAVIELGSDRTFADSFTPGLSIPFKSHVTLDETKKIATLDIGAIAGNPFTGKTPEEIEKEFEGKGYGIFKAAVGEAAADVLAPIGAEYTRLMADKGYLEALMKKGKEQAEFRDSRTLRKVYKKVGFAQLP